MSVIYLLPKKQQQHKSMLLRGVVAKPPMLTAADQDFLTRRQQGTSKMYGGGYLEKPNSYRNGRDHFSFGPPPGVRGPNLPAGYTFPSPTMQSSHQNYQNSQHQQIWPSPENSSNARYYDQREPASYDQNHKTLINTRFEYQNSHGPDQRQDSHRGSHGRNHLSGGRVANQSQSVPDGRAYGTRGSPFNHSQNGQIRPNSNNKRSSSSFINGRNSWLG